MSFNRLRTFAVLIIVIYMIATSVLMIASDNTLLILTLELIPPAFSFIMLLIVGNRLQGVTRRSWQMLAAGVFSFLIGQIFWCYYAWTYGYIPVSMADIFWDLQTLFFIIAFVRLFFNQKKGFRSIRIVFDSLLLIIVVTAISWELIIQPNLASLRIGFPTISGMALLMYPVLDLLLLSCLVLAWWVYRRLFHPVITTLLTLSFMLQLIADPIYFYEVTANHRYTYGGWLDHFWSLELFGLALAALYRMKAPLIQPSGSTTRKSPPYFAMLRRIFPYVCLLVLLYFLMDRISRLDGIVIGCAAAIVLVLIRQVTVLSENESLLGQVQRALAKAEYSANHDALSELPNRRFFENKLADALKEAASRGESIAVLFMDLDRFKFINDSFGHATGDMLIRAVADRLKGIVNDGNEMVGRLGGDEFTVLVRRIGDTEELVRLAGLIVQTIAQPYKLEDIELQTTTSVGIALYPQDGIDASELMKQADAAMYRAKELGGNRFQFYGELRGG